MGLCRVFIDGQEGTTGLGIRERFAARSDIEIIPIAEEERKNAQARAERLNECDFAFLCLPDDAAREAVSLISNPNVRVIDASTAHRTAEGWAYGFPELVPAFRERIAAASRVAVPGCYASGFNALCRPLVDAGILPADYPVVCHAVSGYSGAGKKGIALYEGEPRPQELSSPRLYALTQRHKHLAEMKAYSCLAFEPAFSPYICNFYSGMSVTVPLFARLLLKKIAAKEVRDVLAAHYQESSFIRCLPFAGEGAEMTDTLGGYIAANSLAGTNRMEIIVSGNDERMVLTARFDNLGKGASGAAVQCLNIMMGVAEDKGLE